MGDIPESMLTHRVSVRAPLGFTGTGAPIYGDPFTVPCLIEFGRKVTRSSVTGVGDQATSPATMYCLLSEPIAIGAQVTITAGEVERVTTVAQVYRRDGGGLPTPDHLEIVLV